MPPYTLDARCLGPSPFRLLFSLIFKHLPAFFKRKLRRWMPLGWMPGAVGPPHPLSDPEPQKRGAKFLPKFFNDLLLGDSPKNVSSSPKIFNVYLPKFLMN